MAHKISSDGAAVVAPSVKWLRIDESTPRNTKMLLISEKYGVAQVCVLVASDKHYTHWHPLPTFTRDEK